MGDNSMDLLFRIAADSTPAQADMQALRAAMAGNLTGMGGQIDRFSAGATSSFSAAMAKMMADSKTAHTAILYDWAGNPIKQIADDFTGMGEAATGAARR